MVSGKNRWRSSERIAAEYLGKRGYRIIAEHVPVRINGVDVSEIDFLVVDDSGEKYGVEVKAGRVDVNGVRQAYVNALLLGVKPLIVAKGFSDESARVLAGQLGVRVYELSDAFLVDAEELEVIVRSSLESIIAETLSYALDPPVLGDDDRRILLGILRSPTIMDFARIMDVSVEDAVRLIRRLRDKGILRGKAKNYRAMRLYAAMILAGDIIKHLLQRSSSVDD